MNILHILKLQPAEVAIAVSRPSFNLLHVCCLLHVCVLPSPDIVSLLFSQQSRSREQGERGVN